MFKLSEIIHLENNRYKTVFIDENKTEYLTCCVGHQGDSEGFDYVSFDQNWLCMIFPENPREICASIISYHKGLTCE